MTKTTGRSASDKPRRSKESSFSPKGKQARAVTKKALTERDVAVRLGVGVETVRKYGLLAKAEAADAWAREQAGKGVLERWRTLDVAGLPEAVALTVDERLAVARRSELAMRLYDLSRNAAVPAEDRSLFHACADAVCGGNVDQAYVIYNNHVRWVSVEMPGSDRKGMEERFRYAKIRPPSERRELTRVAVREELARIVGERATPEYVRLSVAEQNTLAHRIALAEALHRASLNASYSEKSRALLAEILYTLCSDSVKTAQAMHRVSSLREGMPRADFDALGALFPPAIGGAEERNAVIADELKKVTASWGVARPKGFVEGEVKFHASFFHGPPRHREIPATGYPGEAGGTGTREEHRRSVSDDGYVSLEWLREKERKDRKDEGTITDELAAYFKTKNLPRDLWESTAAEIERVVRKQVATNEKRPLWGERARYPDLAHLPAPEFLKRVWADAIGPDGSIEKETVRRIDRGLMASVEAYVANRERRNLDAGSAAGLRLIAQKTRPARGPGLT